MTLKKPLYLQAGEGDEEIEYSALDWRSFLHGLFRGQGIMRPDTVAGGLKVTQRAAGANMSVDVAAGRCIIEGDAVADQGKYFCWSTDVVNVAVPDPPASGDRIHWVVARLYDDLHDSSGEYKWTIELIEDDGSGAEVPDSAVPLAQVAVSSGQSSVTNSDISDQRINAPLVGSMPPQVASDSVRPPVPYESELLWRTDKDCHEVALDDAGNWAEIPRRGGGGSAWTTYTPTLTGTESNPTLGSGATAQGRYWRVGRTVTVEVIIKFGSGMSKGGGFYEVSLPVTARTQTVGRRTGSAYVFDNSANEFYDGISFINSGATTKARLSINSDVVQDDVPITFAASDELGFQITYEAAS